MMLALQNFRHDLYDAETLHDACCAVLRAVPRWLPWVSAGALIMTYAAYIRVRLFLARWRRAVRWRAERKYAALGYVTADCFDLGDFFSLNEEEEDDEEDNVEDGRTLGIADIEEFRRSLGIRWPRDDDLLVMVEEMLLVDTIPDGWVLYRTTTGVVRFLNLNTQELCFFHPGRRADGRYILAEVQRRNRAAIESKYRYSCLMEELTWREDSPTVPLYGTKQNKTISFSKEKDFQRQVTLAIPRGSGDDEYDKEVFVRKADNEYEDDDNPKDEHSTFRRVLSYFVEREKRRIEKDAGKNLKHSTTGVAAVRD